MTTPNANAPAAANGPLWAAILAAGIGCASFGVAVDLAEAVKPVSKVLNLYNPTGDLSGKSTVAVLVWLLAWALLHRLWKNQKIQSTRAIMAVTAVLVVIAAIAIFPPFFGLFAPL